MQTRLKIICGNWKDKKDVVYEAQRRVFLFLWTNSFDFGVGEVISFRSKSKIEVLEFIEDMKDWKNKIPM